MDAGAAEGLRHEMQAVARQSIRKAVGLLLLGSVGFALVYLGVSLGFPPWLVLAAVVAPAILLEIAFMRRDFGRSHARLHEAASRLQDIIITEWRRGGPLLPPAFRIPLWYRLQGGYHTMRTPPHLSRLQLGIMRIARTRWRRWMLPLLPAIAFGGLGLGLLLVPLWGVGVAMVAFGGPLVVWYLCVNSLEWAEGLLAQLWEYERIAGRKVLPAELERPVSEPRYPHSA